MNDLYQNIANILHEARSRSYRAVNSAMIAAYWNIGQQIVEEEQQGKHRAEYGTKLLPYLAKKLQADFGKGFDERNLRNMRLFYLTFPIWNALRTELTWTHYRLLLKVSNEKVLEAEKNETVVKYSVLQDNQQLFVSKYKLFLPSEEELRIELERERQFLMLQGGHET